MKWNFSRIALVTLGSWFCAHSPYVLSQDCSKDSIVKPTPFMGNNDEIFVLASGSVWQVKYEYEYLYAYTPNVAICPSKNLLIINGKKLNVIPLSQTQSGSGAGQGVINSQIDGAFNGWRGETIYRLRNGQIWQQASYYYRYRYAYSPSVMIYKDGGTYKMIVDGDNDRPIPVKRLE